MIILDENATTYDEGINLKKLIDLPIQGIDILEETPDANYEHHHVTTARQLYSSVNAEVIRRAKKFGFEVQFVILRGSK